MSITFFKDFITYDSLSQSSQIWRVDYLILARRCLLIAFEDYLVIGVSNYFEDFMSSWIYEVLKIP